MSTFNYTEHIIDFAKKEIEDGKIPSIKEYIHMHHKLLSKLPRTSNESAKVFYSGVFINVCETNNIEFTKNNNFNWGDYFGEEDIEDNNNNNGSSNSPVAGQKRNISNISEVVKSSTGTTITSKYFFMTSGGDFSCETVDQWILNGQVDQNVTVRLMDLRRRSLSLAQANQKTNPLQVLSLNFVFFFSIKRSKSITRSLPPQWHTAQWLTKLSTLSTPLAMKKQCVAYLNEALTLNDDELFQIVEFLFKYTPKAFKWSMTNMVEDTFIKNSIADIIETFVNDYNEDSTLRFEWANKKLSTSPLKPDYTLSCQTNEDDEVYLDLFVIEIKAPGRNRTSSDFQKTGFILKEMIDKLVKIGLNDPLVCGLVVDGYESYVYLMKPEHEAIYPLYETSVFSLPRSPADIPTISSIIVAMKQLVDLLSSTINQINNLEEAKVSNKISFIRDSFGYGKEKSSPSSSSPSNLPSSSDTRSS